MTYKTLSAALLASAFAFGPVGYAAAQDNAPVDVTPSADDAAAPDSGSMTTDTEAGASTMSSDGEMSADTDASAEADMSSDSESMASDSEMSSESASMDNPTVGGAAMDPSMTIVENASNAPNLTTLVSAVQAADLVETLSGEGPFTVFAPTNEAFEALPAGTVDTLLEPENKALLAGILTYHVVPADVMSDAIAQMIEDDGGSHEVTTVNGATFTVRMDGENLVIDDLAGNTATVVTADVDQSNGVVHVIDTVLQPGTAE